ncbi:monoglyceride lipase-like [Dysidea avara]|uniref:monoglyceride lipase-like n=1 Tax=Dysidea avara TaxID=196820 RepID=UPI00331E9D0D
MAVVNQSDFFQNADSQKIFVRSWVPDCDPVAVLYIVHGVAEHSGRYENLAALLNENEIAVYSQDLVGHVKAKYSSNIPFFMMGHSMGGLVTTLFTIQRPDLINGVVLSAPALVHAAGAFLVCFRPMSH